MGRDTDSVLQVREDVGAAYERLKTGDVRFRFALDISTIAQDRRPSRGLNTPLDQEQSPGNSQTT